MVQQSTPLPSVSAAMASSTGLDAITLPVALVATGAVVRAGATTAMTAPVAARATPRPSTSRPARRHVLRTRRVWRAYVHDHPRRARRPSRVHCPRPRRAPAFAAPQRPPPPPRPGCADAAGAAGAAGAGGRRQSRSQAVAVAGARRHRARGGAPCPVGRPAAPSPPLAWCCAAAAGFAIAGVAAVAPRVSDLANS